MLIQQAEKKENSSSKRYEMSKWSFGNAILMTDWKTVFSATLHFIVLKFLMTHKQMMNWILSQTFLTNEAIYNLNLEIYASLPMCVSVCVCVSFSAVIQIGCWDITTQWIFSINIAKVCMICLMYYSGTMSILIKSFITFYFLIFFWTNRIAS